MKKQLFTVLAFLCLFSPAFGQLYVRVNVGYNLPMNAQVIGHNTKETYVPDVGYEGSAEGVYGSYGSGVAINAAIGGNISGNLGYDVEVGYVLGKKYSTEYDYEYPGYTEQEKLTSYARSFQFAPALSFTAGTGNIQPYTRMGPVLAFTKLTGESESYNTYNDNTVNQTIEASGGISFGFKGALGVTLNADKKIQFFIETNFTSLSYSPKKGEYTQYTVNGTDALESFPDEQRKFKFKDKIDEGDSSNTQLKEKFSLGSLGLQAGIKFSF